MTPDTKKVLEWLKLEPLVVGKGNKRALGQIDFRTAGALAKEGLAEIVINDDVEFAVITDKGMNR